MLPTLRLLLVDDEGPALLRLQTVLGDIAAACPTTVVGTASHAQAALALLHTQTVDAVLLDIQMPGMTGLELARHIQLLRQQAGQTMPAIIFTTAYDQHALEAFELQALDYLMKPVRAQRLQDALQRVAARLPHASATLDAGVNVAANEQTGSVPNSLSQALQRVQRQQLTIHQRGKLLLVPLNEVVYFKAELKYVTVRTHQAEYLLEESLIALEEEFAAHFIRIHRNALVAKTAIMGFERSKSSSKLDEDAPAHIANTAATTAASSAEEAKGGSEHWEVILAGIPERLPISRRQWPAVKALLPGRRD